MRSLRTLLVVSFFISFFILWQSTYAQTGWLEGFIVFENNDTLRGTIRNRKNPSTLAVYFKDQNGKKKVYYPTDLKSYGVGDRDFESHLYIVRTQFFERKVNGHLDLFVQKNKRFIREGNREIEKVNRLIFRSVILDYISDNEELSERVNKYELTYSDLDEIVREYNKSKPSTKLVKTDDESLKMNLDNQNKLEDSSNINAASSLMQNEMNKLPGVMFKINLLGIGAGFETKIVKPITIYIEGGSGFLFFFSTSEGSSITLFPYVKIQPRIYLNLSLREDLGMKTKSTVPKKNPVE